MADTNAFDVIVIGGGPAGYPAAIRAGQNKLSVACIDEWKNLDGAPAFGGTCLNAGCIPSKALLESSELYHKVQTELAVHGIKVSGASLDLAAMQKRKAGIVKGMTGGILALFKGAGVTPLQGHGKLLSGKRVEFTAHDGTQAHADCARTSCSRRARRRPSCARRRSIGKNIVDSWGALEFDAVPEASRRDRRGRHRPRARQRVEAPRE